MVEARSSCQHLLGNVHEDLKERGQGFRGTAHGRDNAGDDVRPAPHAHHQARDDEAEPAERRVCTLTPDFGHEFGDVNEHRVAQRHLIRLRKRAQVPPHLVQQHVSGGERQLL
jgi:hypothetical protein